MGFVYTGQQGRVGRDDQGGGWASVLFPRPRYAGLTGQESRISLSSPDGPTLPVRLSERVQPVRGDGCRQYPQTNRTNGSMALSSFPSDQTSSIGREEQESPGQFLIVNVTENSYSGRQTYE